MDGYLKSYIDECFLEGIVDEFILKDHYKSRQGTMDSETKSNINKAIEDFKKNYGGKSKFARVRFKVDGWMLNIDGVDAGLQNTVTYGDPLSMIVGNAIGQGGGYLSNRIKTTSALNKCFKKYGLMVKLHKSKLVDINNNKFNPYFDVSYKFNIYKTKALSKKESYEFDSICDAILNENYYENNNFDFFIHEANIFNSMDDELLSEGFVDLSDKDSAVIKKNISLIEKNIKSDSKVAANCRVSYADGIISVNNISKGFMSKTSDKGDEYAKDNGNIVKAANVASKLYTTPGKVIEKGINTANLSSIINKVLNVYGFKASYKGNISNETTKKFVVVKKKEK